MVGVRKMAIFVMFSTYCIYADISGYEWLGGSEKVQKYADVIQGWSLSHVKCLMDADEFEHVALIQHNR